MSKFKNSAEALDSALQLWPSAKHTNTSVSNIYDLNVYPLNPIVQGAGQTISFNIPPQETGFLMDIETVAQFHVTKIDANLPAKTQVSIVNNIGTAMFSLVEFRLEERINLLQQMSNSYNLCSFFETVLNNAVDRTDILAAREMFIMDGGSTKAKSEAAHYFIKDNVAVIDNVGAQKRAKKIALSAKCTVKCKLNVPLVRQHKALLPNTKLTITFTQNKASYCVMGAEEDFKFHIDDLYLRCTYIKANPELHRVIDSYLERHPVTYECDKQVILARLLPQGSQHFTINNIFDHHNIPKFVLFALQHPESMSGKFGRDNFTFYPIKSLQMFVNNQQYFPKALTNDTVHLLDQIYKSVGRDISGTCLVTGSNLVLNQFYTLVLTDDRSFGSHYNLKRNADTRIEIDIGEVTTHNFVLLAYCLYDTQITISKGGEVTINE